MAYQAKGTHFDSGVTKEDKTRITQYQAKWAAADEASRAAMASGDAAAYQAAEAQKQQAHADAEAVRGRYGYSGGEDGSAYLPARVETPTQTDGGAAERAYEALSRAQDAAYQRRLAAQQAARDAAVGKAVSSLEAQRADAEQQYAELFRQLYLDKMNSRKNLEQRLAAGGVTGGAAETTRLGYDTAYEDALRQGEQGRIGALGTIDRAITDVRLASDAESAAAAAEAAKEQTSAYTDAWKYLLNRQDALDARQESNEREDAAAARRYAYETAMQLINAGTLPSAPLLASAGIDGDTARELVAAVVAAAAEDGKPSLTAAQVLEALKRGVRTRAVLDAYAYYYGEPYSG